MKTLPQANRAQSGFSMMELLVVIALFALMVGLATPYVSGILGVRVKSAARQMAGTIRYLFDESVLKSSNFRLVFNLDRHGYIVEMCPGATASILYRNADEREIGLKQLEEKLRRMEDYASSSSQKQLAAPLSDSMLQSCSQSQDPNLAPVVLDDPLTLLGVWTPQYPSVMRGDPVGPPDNPEDDLTVAVNFLKGGYAERAFIYLSDGGDEIYTLEIQPLTGQVLMYEGEYEVPMEYWR